MKRPVSLFASFSLFLACGIAHAQVAPPLSQPATTQSTTPTPLTEASARAAFDKLEAARLATQAGTQQRAEAASAASEAAAQVAWVTFDAGHFDEAAKWFARRAALRQEGYAASKNTLNAQIVEVQNTRKTKVAGAKTESEKMLWLDMTGTMQHIALTQIQILARQNNDPATIMDAAQKKLAVDREQLALAQSAPATDPNKAKNVLSKTLDVIGSLEDVASAQSETAQWDEAEKTYAQAHAMRRALPPDTPGRDLAEGLRELAILRDAQGDLSGARRFYEQALAMRIEEEPLRRKVIEASSPENRPLELANDGAGEVMMLNNLGYNASASGDFKASQVFYDQALARADTMPQEGFAGRFRLQLRAITQANVASLHADQGLLQQARGEMEAAIAIQRQLGSDDNAATGLANLSGLLYEQNDLETARRYLDQARQIAVNNQNLPKVVSFTLSLASLLRQMNRLPEAEKLASEGLVLARQTGNWSLNGDAARTMANIRLAQNQPAQAEVFLQEASLSDKRVGAPVDAAVTLELQGRVREAQNDLPGAVALYKQAVTLREGVRSTSSSESDFAGLKENSKVYERLVQALIKLNRGEEAFDYMSRSRSKALQDVLRVDSLKTGNKEIQALLDRAGALDVRTRSIEAQLETEQAKPDAQRDTTKIQNLQSAIASTRGEWRKATEEIKATNPSYDKLFSVKPMALGETQRSIPEDAAFIMYVPLKASESGEEQLYTFVVTRESLKIFTPNVKAADLWTRIRAVRRQIALREDASFTRGLKGSAMTDIIGRGDPNDKTLGEPTKPGEPSLSDNLVALNDMLITPIQSEIASKKLLAFIPTELLYYLPMQALAKREGNDLHFLIEDKEVVYLTGADVMKVVQTPVNDKATSGMVAFGDPIGANLPSAGVEVRTIAQIFPGSTDFEGAQVTKASVTDAGNLNRRVVHFATHGILNPTIPANSYILLSPGKTPSDQQLTVGEVWDLPLQKVDLVTLSACNTALGERDPNGSELTTLAEAFSSAGANTVLASLWSVSDDSTKDLMVEFYRQLAGGKTKSAALRAAELSVMSKPGNRHPYFWAPFILMGDWR